MTDEFTPKAQRSELQQTCREIHDELGYIWTGDLAGMEVVPVITIGPDGPEARLELRHRTCDDRWPIPEDGIAADGSAYVANIAVQAREARDSHSCTVRERSAEHQARVARWLTAANLPHTGDPARDQLAMVRNIAQAVRPAGMTEAEMDEQLRRAQMFARAAADGYPPEFEPDEMSSCRVMETRTCPPSGSCPGPCARFGDDGERLP